MDEFDPSKLSYDELVEEIKNETTLVESLSSALASAREERVGVLETIDTEELPRWEDRYGGREERIEELTELIKTRSEKRAEREERIRVLEESVAFQRRAGRARTSLERFMARELAERSRRSLSSLRGWQTRDTRAIESARLTLRSLKGWQTREAPYMDRLTLLRERLGVLDEEIRGLIEDSAEEEARLELKKVELDRFRAWRVQKARTYYAYRPGKDTPEPFAEYRVWIYLRAKDKEDAENQVSESSLASVLNEVEFAISRAAGRTHIVWAQSVEEQQAYESREVDPEEVDAEFGKRNYGVVFWERKPDGTVQEKGKYGTSYVEEQLGEGLEGLNRPDRVSQIGLEDWRRRPVPPRRRTPRRRR